MSRHLHIQMNSFPIAGIFTISRGAKTTAEVVTCAIEDGESHGWGECVPYRRYGESLDGVIAARATVR